jgi:hypothetical protein
LWVINAVIDVLTTTDRRQGREGVFQHLQLAKNILTKPGKRHRSANSRGVPKNMKVLPVAKNSGINQHFYF